MAHQSRSAFRTDILILIGILCLMAVLEISFRATKTKVSGDLKFLETVPDIARTIDTAKGVSVMFVGNSLIGEAIDKSIMREEFSIGTSTPILVEKMVPDDTNLPDWYFLYKNFFSVKKHQPEVMVIGFAWRNALQDGGIVKSRIVDFACNAKDLPEVSLFGIVGPEKTTEFFLAKISSLFANHAVIRNRILDILVPHYREGTRLVNNAANKNTHRPVKEIQPSFSSLQRFIAMLVRSNVRPVFIAMPVIDPYSINPELLRVLAENCDYIDCRNVPGLDHSMFVDPIHLGESGRKIFSQYLAEKMKVQIHSESIKKQDRLLTNAVERNSSTRSKGF